MRQKLLFAVPTLAAMTLPTPATAATIAYDFSFNRTYEEYDERWGESPWSGQLDPSGSFIFDTASNQLVSFNVDPGYPPTYGFSAEVFTLFANAGPCDLKCFIRSINGNAWSTRLDLDGLTTTLNFGAPLGGQATAGVGFSVPWSASIGGTYRVNAPVPEPSTWALLLVGFAFVGGAMRSKRRQAIKVSYV